LTPEDIAEIKRLYNEAEKSPSDMHQFMQWYFHHIKTAQALPEVEGGLVRVPPDGITESLFLLLYELYVLRHHTSLQQEVIRRLKHPEHFQGARYELFVAATMIRTGCDINYEDENDGSRKHPEFIAHHSATGQRFAVEAKSRHRPGILGYPGEPQQVDQINLGIRRRLKSAVEKDVSGPFIVFMDVNLPPEYVERHGYSWGNEANSTFERLTKRNTQALSVNVAYFTNFPFHYGMSGRNKRYSSFHVSIVRNPKFSFSQVGLIDVINTSLKQYGNVPNEFPE